MTIKEFEECKDCRWECASNTKRSILNRIFRNNKNIQKCRLSTSTYSKYFGIFVSVIGIYFGLRAFLDTGIRFETQLNGVNSKGEKWSTTRKFEKQKWGEITKEISDE